MPKLKSLCLLFCVLILFGCESKYHRAMQGGRVMNTNFVEKIPFDFSFGIPLMQVKIQGKSYQFLFDTGAPNVIGKELADQLKYKTISTVDISDSQGVKQKQKTILVDELQIGDVLFKGMAALIIDYNKVFELGCLKIDGIIGSNLMSKLYWQIDYESKEITFTDRMSLFDIPQEHYVLPMRERWSQKKPLVRITMDRMTFNNVTFDTGATGGFSMVMGAAKDHIDSLAIFTMKGSNSVGVYGDGGSSDFKYVMIDTVRLGNLELFDQLIEFESKGAMTLGNRFLKGYRVILDWHQQQVILIENLGFDHKKEEHFGIRLKFKEEKVYVGALVSGSYAEAKGLEIGTQILQMNDYNLRSVNDSLGCYMIKTRMLDQLDTLQLTFDRNGMETQVMLMKQDFTQMKQKS
ncbi:aspartyl protease family protein [Portibacter marinus]|uniref:aspartyl protease family protein n=1 Tax=Portibacter marinus TaxID=2898660 RepID=UPI001F1B8447|nr:aspartyl protease family protein [Portibacter marinus]